MNSLFDVLLFLFHATVPFHQMNGDQASSQLTSAQATALKAAQMHRQPHFTDLLNQAATPPQQSPAAAALQGLPMVSQSQSTGVMSPQVPVQAQVQPSKPPLQPQSPAQSPAQNQMQTNAQSQGQSPASPAQAMAQANDNVMSRSPSSTGKGNGPSSPCKPPSNMGKTESADKMMPPSPSMGKSQKSVCLL